MASWTPASSPSSTLPVVWVRTAMVTAGVAMDAVAEEAEIGTTIAAGTTTIGTVIAVTDPAAAARATVGAALAPGRGAPLVIVTVPTALPPEAVAVRNGTTIAAEAEMIVDIPIVAVIGVTEDMTVVDMIKQISV